MNRRVDPKYCGKSPLICAVDSVNYTEHLIRKYKHEESKEDKERLLDIIRVLI